MTEYSTPQQRVTNPMSQPSSDDGQSSSITNNNCRIQTINVISHNVSNSKPIAYSRHSEFVEINMQQKKAAKAGIKLNDQGQPKVYRHSGQTGGYCH